MRPSFLIPGAIIAAGVLIAFAVYHITPKPAPGAETGDPALVRPVGASDHILGNPAARVMIVEYSDYNCTYCKSFNDTMHEVIANEGADGDVAWVYRQFPLTELHETSFALARAAECAASAGGNDGFWKFSEALYDNQPVVASQYGALAASAGIPGAAFAQCYASASTTVDARIAADRQNALDAGAEGTPYSLLLVRESAGWRSPVVIEGAYPYTYVKQLIDDALGK